MYLISEFLHPPVGIYIVFLNVVMKINRGLVFYIYPQTHNLGPFAVDFI